MIDGIYVRAIRRIESVPTESGAHTTALDVARHMLYIFLPKTHRAAVFADGLGRERAFLSLRPRREDDHCGNTNWTVTRTLQVGPPAGRSTLE